MKGGIACAHVHRCSHLQAPALLELLRPLLWEGRTVEPALQCVLRVLRGNYALPQPYWLAGLGTAGGTARGHAGGVADLALRSWAAREQAEAHSLPRYGTPMYHGAHPWQP